MGIFSDAVAIFKVDTSDMEAGLKRLTGIEKEHQKQILESAKERNSSYDGWIAKMGNVNQALELGGKVVSFLSDSWREYADDVKLAAAVGTTNIDRLRQASLGLRTEQELMEFASKATHGQIKANQTQMETAERAMVALTRAGFDQHEVTEKITSAMVSLKTKGLESLGVTVKEGKSDLETYTNLMAALGEKAKGVDENSMTAAEGMQKMSVSMSDSIDNMKSAVGELVQALAPLLAALAEAVALIAEAAGGVLKGNDPMAAAAQALETRQRILDAMAGGGSQSDMLARYAAGSERNKRQVVGAYDRWNNDELGGMDEGSYASFMRKRGLMGDQGKPVTKTSDLGDISTSIRRGSYEGIGGVGTASKAFADWISAQMPGPTKQPGSLTEIDPGLASGRFSEMREELEKLQAALKAPAARQQSFLESSFGKLEDFNAYATAFGMLTGSVTSAMDAWITGSMSAGDAVKAFIGQALKGLASQMAIEALKHGAYAIGSLAFGDLRGAGTHAAAAGAFGAAAAAAAVAAKEFGGGGANYGKGGGASTGGGGGGSGSTLGGSTTSRGADQSEKNKSSRPLVVILGSSFDETTPRQRARTAQQALDKAIRERDE